MPDEIEDGSARLQSDMDPERRRQLGAHYTSEPVILALLDPLLLDDLRVELEAAKGSSASLEQFLLRLRCIRVLDPACGCGDFLVIAYRELRRLELAALKCSKSPETSESHARVDLDQCWGFEIDPRAAEVARGALRQADQREDLYAAAELERPARTPRSTAPNILELNALALDWASVLAPGPLVFIVGNPPFVGKKEQSAAQKADMKRVFPDLTGVGKLDYVSCWFMLAARYASQNPTTSIAFVATNSVTQGEQVGILWAALFELGVTIDFAHRSFQWTSQAKGKAAVQCVIVGFGLRDRGRKRLFDYDTAQGTPQLREVETINAYLVAGPNVLMRDRPAPLGGPAIGYGSFALDGGHYTLDRRERDQLLAACPAAESFVRAFVGGKELLHSKARFCLWLVDATQEQIEAMPEVAKRVEAVKDWRSTRARPETRALAATPTRFAEIRQPTTRYLAIPTLSSEQRAYIPIAFLEPSVIASNQVYVVEGATLHHFGVLTSQMHMTWVRAVCGRLESRYRYSAGIVYNNFPWPEPDAEQRTAIEARAQAVLDARAAQPQDSLAQLYDPRTMPPKLAKAHRELDEAVASAYAISEISETERAAALFALHLHRKNRVSHLRQKNTGRG